MNEHTMRFRLGVFVLSAFLLLAVLITLFGGFPNLFRTFDRYTVVFDEAAGVSSGTPVRRSGVRIGEVEKVELDDATGKVRLGLKVDSQYTIRKGDRPTLARSLLGGDTSIDFLPPEPGRQADLSPVEPGTELAGAPTAEAADLVRQASRLMPPAERSLQVMEQVLVKIDRMTPVMEEAVREIRDVARVTREAVPSIRGAADELREVAKAGRELVPSMKRASDEIGELAKSTRETIPELRKTNEQIGVTAKSWNQVGDRVDRVLRENEKELTAALNNLNAALKNLNATFNDENQKNLSETLKNVRVGSERMDSITRNTDELMKESRVTMKRVNDSITRADGVLSNLQQATAPMADKSKGILRNLDEATHKLNVLMTDVQDLFRAASRCDGTIQRLLTDPSLYNRLDEAACGLLKLMPRVDRILRDVETFADRIARHPEALGIGGVVRPSSGLKEAPSTWYRAPGH